MTPNDMAQIMQRAYQPPLTPWTCDSLENTVSDRSACISFSHNGFAIGRVILDEVELLAFAIDPAQQNQGFGRLLLQRFEAEAAARGAQQCHLEVAETNNAAKTLYLKAGYAIKGKRPKYYALNDGTKVAALLMTKAIGPDNHRT